MGVHRWYHSVEPEFVVGATIMQVWLFFGVLILTLILYI